MNDGAPPRCFIGDLVGDFVGDRMLGGGEAVVAVRSVRL
eukprot:CAMPEP_0181244576 /NCGR_PEP_ID=MMETSP1096-20121128/42940_1 /TAXON_ID=156174 ORGANISM="Chrysochromulina ericina, Strain CCMP281" /NCGR_SAMPLE_ID=MMETSP1096 /ASSEMBLY_ACC=CAM_ASM_000453 /LENGTH=38 /DNA_ID= /DNA_START= /DNA_END= /DNA_ORIENTATION=